jgi:hypothetical protein
MQVLLFLLLLTFTHSFVFLPKKIQNKSKTQINCYFYNEDYPSDCNEYNEELEEPIFIVIWKETKKTEKLLFEMRKQGLHTVFIPENTFDTFQLTTDDMPLVYKDEIILEDWVDIYSEIYPM